MCERYSLQTPADTFAKHFQPAKVPAEAGNLPANPYR